MTTRRGFFGMIAGAVVGGRKAAEAAAMELAGVTGPIGIISHGSVAPSGWGNAGVRVAEDMPSLPRAALRLMGIPESMRRQWREDTRHVYRLDADIASYRWASLSAKIQMQRERNYQRMEDHFFAGSAWLDTQKWLEGLGYGGIE